jgi:Tfp pilus assembly protein PilE
MNFRNKKTRGYSIIEIVFYIAIFAVLSLTVINSLIVMVRSFAETTVQKDFLQTGVMMERISREIRQSKSVASISSSDLKLNSTDSSGTAKTVEFLISGTNLQFKENGVLTGNLNDPNIQITNVTFTQITTAKGKAIKIQMSAKDMRDRSARTENFYDTIEMRGSYAS